MMKKPKLVGLIIALFSSGIAILLSNQFKAPENNLFFLIAGSIILLIISFFVFKSRKVFLYLLFGMVLTAFGYSMVVVFWSKSSPQISLIIFTLTVLLSIIFFGLASFKIIKQLFNNKK